MAGCKHEFQRFCRVVSIVVIILAAATCTTALGSLIVADTVNAIPGWYGTEIVQFEESGEFVDGSIDYAVYAPGQFNLSFPGQDPSSGAHYVYRYQLHNNAVTSTDFMKKLSVGLVGITNAANCKVIEPGPLYPVTGTIAPTQQVKLIGTPPTSAVWSFKSTDPPVNPGYSSKMLIFTSPNSPTRLAASLYSQATDTWWEGSLPSPIPEPVSLVSLLIFCCCLFAYRVLRRN